MSIVYKDSSEITQADIKKDRLHAIQYISLVNIQ